MTRIDIKITQREVYLNLRLMYNLTSISKIAMVVESSVIALMLLTNFYDVSWVVVFALIDPSSIVDEFSIF
jgi:hypothetical protein